jgi:hypothetical protein
VSSFLFCGSCFLQSTSCFLFSASFAFFTTICFQFHDLRKGRLQLFEPGNCCFIFSYICVIYFWCIKQLWTTFIMIVTRGFIFGDRKLISRRVCTGG